METRVVVMKAKDKRKTYRTNTQFVDKLGFPVACGNESRTSLATAALHYHC
jgi:hypothetical protein